MEKAKGISLNPLFFGVFFFFIAALHSAHILLIEPENLIVSIAFILQVLFQTFFEGLVLALLAGLIQKGSSRIVPGFFIGLTLVLLVLHIVELPLIRLMDINIVSAIPMVLQESGKNFFEMLQASNVYFSTWMMALIGSICFISFGLFLYFWTLKKSIRFSIQTSFVLLGGAFFLTLPIAKWSNEKVDSMSCQKFCQALPWKTLFHNYEKTPVFFPKSLHPFPNEEEVVKALARVKKNEANPDIFLFVIESLRSDFLDSKTAPHFTAFRSEAIAPALGISSGNGTQLSWFSLFYSKFPFYFTQSKMDKRKDGGFTLQYLKKLGYDIHVFSSSRLAYYDMDRRIFGPKKELCDSFQTFLRGENYEKDQNTIAALKEAVLEKKGGNCFITFLESTHFDYSFPPNQQKPFTTYLPTVNHVKLAFSKKKIPLLQNRYRNAIHFVDGLFGDVRKHLENEGRWEDSIVVLTGDHGEEFYEEGHLFHASNLNAQQTHVPIYFKFGSKALPTEMIAEQVSHVDIFPTIFHYVTGNHFLPLFDGESIFHPKKWPYSITGRYNGALDPFAFIIQKGQEKIWVQFDPKTAWKNSQHLRVIHNKQADAEMALAPIFLRLSSGCY